MASATERTIRGGAGFFVANATSKCASFVFLCLASRLLGANDFGILALALSVFGVLHGLAAFGLPTAALRFLSGKVESRSAAAYGSILWLSVVSAGAASALLFFGARAIALEIFDLPALVIPLRVLAVGILVGVPGSVCRSVLQAQERIRPFLVTDVIQNTGKILILLAAFPILPFLETPLWAVVISAGLSMLLIVRYLKGLELQPAFRGLGNEIRRISAFAAPVAIVGLGYVFSMQADRLMLGALADTSAVATYTAASTLAMLGTILHGSMISVFMPVASEHHRKGIPEETHKAYLTVGKWVGSANGMLLLTYIAIGPLLLGLFGREHSTREGQQVLLLLTLLYFLGTWVGPTGALLQMTDGHRIELVNTLLFLVTNILLNAWLIPIYGVIGAALATLFSGLFRNACQLMEIRYWHRFVPVSVDTITVLLLTLVGGTACFMIDRVEARATAALVIALMLVLNVFWRATPEERHALLKLSARAGTASEDSC